MLPNHRVRMAAKQFDFLEDSKMARDTYKYHFKVGNKIIHTGITNDLDRREREHQNNLNKRGHIKQVGRATTKDAALNWESEQADRGLPTRRPSRH